MERRIVKALSNRERKRVVDDSRKAAVLVPLYEKGGKHYAVFTKRTESLSHHRGQISFPGGAHEEGDEGSVATALREASEEMGIKPEDVRVLGMLDDVVSGVSSYVVTPIVGLIPYPYPFVVNRDEVEDVIEAPLSELSEVEGKYGVEYWYGRHRIWGLTARILKQFLDVIR
ncbi:MAG: NUDIX hydrolase [Candidatus Bathyarchaeia archaeon]